MNNRIKAVGLLTIMLSLAVVVFIFAAYKIVFDNFNELQRKDISEHEVSNQRQIKQHISELSGLTSSYGNWDESYAYALTQHKIFEDKNLVFSPLAQMNISFIAYYTAKSRRISALTVNYQDQLLNPVHPLLCEKLDSLVSFQQKRGLDSAVASFVSVDSAIFLVAARPIYKSDASGPAAGTVIMGLTWDAKRNSDFSKITGARVEISALSRSDQTRLRGAPIDSIESIIPPHIFTSDSLYSNKVILDYHQAPVAMIKTSLPLTLRKQGSSVFRLLIIVMAVCFGLCYFIMLGWLDKKLFSRLQNISNQLERTSEEQSHVRLTPTLQGKPDELESLVNSINDTLQALEDAHQDATIKQQEFIQDMQAVLSAIPDLVMRVPRTIESLEYTFDPAIIPQITTAFSKLSASSEPITFQHDWELNGERIYQEIRVVAVGDNDALVLTRDVSERQRQVQKIIESERKQGELINQLSRNSKVLRIINDFVTEQFGDRNWMELIDNSLAEFGESVGVDRAFIFIVNDPLEYPLVACLRHEWNAPGVTPRINYPIFQNFTFESIGVGEWEDTLTAGEMIVAHQSQLSGSALELIQMLNVQTFALAPVLVEGLLYGAVGYEYKDRTKVDEVDLQALSMAAKVMGLTIQRDQVNKAYRQSEAKYRSLLNAVPDAIAVWDMQGKYLNVKSDSNLELLSDTSLYIGNTLHNTNPKDIADLILYQIHQTLLAEKIQSFVYPQTNEVDGTQTWIEVRMAPLDETSVVGLLQNITKRLSDEQELLKAKEVAESATRAKSEFLATMSHEIRTPMNSIIGMTTMLGRTALTHDQREFLESLRLNSDQLLAIINDILDYSKVEAGMMLIESKSIDTESLTGDILELLSPRVAGKPVELIANIHADVPPSFIADPLRIRQILLNLGGNAVKFTQSGEIEISIRRDQSERAAFLRFEVRDTGIGIPPEKASLLFKRFSQIDSSSSRKFGGTGLGLAISAKLVELMGGTIGVDTSYSGGSLFYFTLPLNEPASEPKIVHPQYPNKRVQVEISNATLYRMVTNILVTSGIEVIAGDASDKPDVAIIDITNATGETPSIIAQEYANRFDGVPMIALMSMDMFANRDVAFQRTFKINLPKPLRYDTMRQAIDAALLGKPYHRQERKSDDQFDSKLAERYPLRILAAEDNPSNQYLLGRLLAAFGYTVKIVEDGVKAVEAVQAETFDIVFMDMHMPEMDGMEATRKIHELKIDPMPAIIALTASTLHNDREHCLQSGMVDFVSKPIRVSELATVLETWGKRLAERDGDESESETTSPSDESNPVEPDSQSSSLAETVHQPASGTTSDLQEAIRFRLKENQFDSDPEFVREYLSAVRQDLLSNVERIRNSLQSNNGTEFTLSAHSIKGICSNLNAVEASKCAHKLELFSKENPIQTVDQELLNTTYSLVEQASSAIDEILSNT